MDNDKSKMSKTSIEKSDEMDIDEDPCSDEDIDNGAPLLDDDDDEDDDDDDDEEDDDNEDIDDDPDYQEEVGSRVSTEGASISIDETSSNHAAIDVPIKIDSKLITLHQKIQEAYLLYFNYLFLKGNFEETISCLPVRNAIARNISYDSQQSKKLNLKIKRWRR